MPRCTPSQAPPEKRKAICFAAAKDSMSFAPAKALVSATGATPRPMRAFVLR